MNMLSALDPGLSGLDQLRALIEAGIQPPMLQTLDIALLSAEQGFVTLEGRPGASHLNPMGGVHGGYMAAILDSACGCAVHSALPPGCGYTTLELKVGYHRPITIDTGVVHAEGRTLSVGRRAAFSEARLTDGAGKLLASATSSLLVMQP